MMDRRKIISVYIIETLNDSTSSSDESNMISISTSSVSSTSIEEENEEGALFFPLMHHLMSGRKRHRVEDYLQVVDSWTNQEFKEHLRLNRHTAIILIEELKLSDYIPSHSFGVKLISAKLSFLIFLWYIANTEPLRTMSDRFNVSISSVFRVLRRIIAWLLTKVDIVIKWPQEHEIMMTCEKFYTKQGIHNVLGAIDSTHIQILKPVTHARNYCNRKKTFSINLQAVVDADMRFTNVYCGEPGSLHDARVFKRSFLYETANINKEILFPSQTFLLGDSAYPCLSWLVPPFRDNGHLSPQQTEFNFMHSSTRIVVERAFGQLKGRFRRIKFFTEYRDISFITNTVVAACILHNYCIAKNDAYDFPEYIDNDFINIGINNEELNNFNYQVDRRMQLFNELFPIE